MVGVGDAIWVLLVSGVHVPLGAFMTEEDVSAGAHMPGPVIVCGILFCPQAKRFLQSVCIWFEVQPFGDFPPTFPC